MTTSTACARLETLARLASVCGLNASEAVYVPATVDAFVNAAPAGKGWHELRMVDELFRNAELRAYFVETIRKAVRAEQAPEVRS